MKNNSVFFSHFFKQSIKKRLVHAFYGVAVTVVVYLFLRWWQPDNVDAQLLALIIGGALNIIYLIGGIAIVIMMVIMIVFVVVINVAPSPWNLLSIVVFLGIIPVWRIIQKRRQKQQLLESDPEMTEAQAAEIIAASIAVNQVPNIQVQREAESIMDAGFLLLETINVPGQKNCLLSLGKKSIVLHVFDDMERILSLLDGNTDAISIPNDTEITNDIIDGITLSTTKAFRKNVLQIKIHTENMEYTFFVSGNISAKQVESFLAEHSDIEINNEVPNEDNPIKSIPDIIEDIKQKDPAELAHMRKIRNVTVLFIVLSVLCMVLVFAGIYYTLLYALIPLCCIATTAFYIRNQQYVRFDGTKEGKSSIFYAYFINPIFTALFVWFVFPIVSELNCLFNHTLTWLAGLLGTAVFLFAIFGLLKESRKSIYMKVGMTIIAIAFGLQLTAVIMIIMHY